MSSQSVANSSGVPRIRLTSAPIRTPVGTALRFTATSFELPNTFARGRGSKILRRPSRPPPPGRRAALVGAEAVSDPLQKRVAHRLPLDGTNRQDDSHHYRGQPEIG